MSIYNINSLQGSSDMNNISEDVKKYILHALANLGQRTGARGAGIEQASFYFYDIFDDADINSDNYPSDKYTGAVQYNPDKSASFFILSKDDAKENVTSHKYTEITHTDTFGKQLAAGVISYDVKINNIEKFSDASVLQVKDGILYTLMYGHIIGSEETTTRSVEIQYDEYDIKSDKLYRAVRIYKDTAADNIYHMYVLDSDMLKYYSFNSYVLSDYNRQQLENAFTYSKLKDSIYFMGDGDITSLAKNLFTYSETEQSLFGLIYTNNGTILKDSPDNLVYLDYNSENEIRYSIKISDGFGSDSVDDDMQTRVDYINKDIIYNIKYFLEYYSENKYTQSGEQIYTGMLMSLYETLLDESKNNNLGKSSIMYIPLDIPFTVLRSDSSLTNIYYSDSICVNRQSTVDDVDIDKADTVTYLCDGYSPGTGIYRIFVRHDSVYDDIITEIDTTLLYSMPVITPDNTWSVNGKDTGVDATALPEHVQNITLLYIDNAAVDAKVPEIILSADMAETSKLSWNIDTDNRICTPVLTDWTDWADTVFIEIWNITGYTGTVICKYENQNFSSVLDDSGNRMGIADILNINHYIDQKMSSYKVYDKPVDQIILNADNNDIIGNVENTDNYAVIKNAAGNEYNDKYNNNLNLKVFYNTELTRNEDGTAETSMSGKYMSGMLKTPSSENVTNVLYPKTVIKENVEVTPLSVTRYGARTDINAATVTDDTRSLTEATAVQITPSERTVTRSTTNYIYSDSDTENYNEYIPNTDTAPSVDLAETPLRNVNIYNRLNIISLDKSGVVYNSYIGTVWDDSGASTGKNILHIGSSESNINIGRNTLTDLEGANSFERQWTLSLDFQQTYTSGMIISKGNIEHNTIDNCDIYNIKITGFGTGQTPAAYADIWENSKKNTDYSYTYISKLENNIISYNIVPVYYNINTSDIHNTGILAREEQRLKDETGFSGDIYEDYYSVTQEHISISFTEFSVDNMNTVRTAGYSDYFDITTEGEGSTQHDVIRAKQNVTGASIVNIIDLNNKIYRVMVTTNQSGSVFGYLINLSKLSAYQGITLPRRGNNEIIYNGDTKNIFTYNNNIFIFAAKSDVFNSTTASDSAGGIKTLIYIRPITMLFISSPLNPATGLYISDNSDKAGKMNIV